MRRCKRLLPHEEIGGYFIMNYSDKLKDPRWQRLRTEVLIRDKYTCVLCKDDKTQLHVHHTRYSGEPWEIPLEALQTLCADCHEIITLGNYRGLISCSKRIFSDNLSLFIYKDNAGEYIFINRHSSGFTLIRIFKDYIADFKTLVDFIK